MSASPDNKGTKIVLLGDVDVGKTAIFTRFKTGTYKKPSSSSMHTAKECEWTKTLTVDGQDTTITLYDTAGMERHQGTIPPTYFRSAKAVIFVYSIANQESIGSIADWMDSVCPQRLQYIGHSGGLLAILVGNKADLEREVTEERGQNTADETEAHLFREISALFGTGFDELFEDIVREIRKRSVEEEKDKGTVSLKPASTSGSGSRGCGCTNFKS